MNETETRGFPIEVVLSLSSGILLCKFGDMHEAAEFVLGQPIWTHEFAMPETERRLKESVLRQCPQLVGEAVPKMEPGDVPDFVAGLRLRHGAKVALEHGNGTRDKNPLESLRELCPDKPVIVVKT